MSDVSEEIDSIIWNVYGKIERVVRTSTSSKSDLEFNYDAMGNRICKIVKPRAGAGVLSQDNWTYTYYLHDASGNVIAVYDRDFERDIPGGQYTDLLSVKEDHLYGSSRVGIRSVEEQVSLSTYTYSSTASNGMLIGTLLGTTGNAASTTNWSHTLKQKAYELSNHLGNVLVTVSDARTANNSGGTVASYTAVVLSAQDYYAFGSSMVGRTVSGDYRYSFNGKEKENEIAEGDLDFGARIYDSRLGRFLSGDRLFKHHPEMTPYAFAANSPIVFIDVNGDEFRIYGSEANATYFTKILQAELGSDYTVSLVFHPGTTVRGTDENGNPTTQTTSPYYTLEVAYAPAEPASTQDPAKVELYNYLVGKTTGTEIFSVGIGSVGAVGPFFNGTSNGLATRRDDLLLFGITIPTDVTKKMGPNGVDHIINKSIKLDVWINPYSLNKVGTYPGATLSVGEIVKAAIGAPSKVSSYESVEGGLKRDTQRTHRFTYEDQEGNINRVTFTINAESGEITDYKLEVLKKAETKPKENNNGNDGKDE